MTNTTPTSKEETRLYLERRTQQQTQQTPLPTTLEEIRRMLGWYLNPSNQAQSERDE